MFTVGLGIGGWARSNENVEAVAACSSDGTILPSFVTSEAVVVSTTAVVVLLVAVSVAAVLSVPLGWLGAGLFGREYCLEDGGGTRGE